MKIIPLLVLVFAMMSTVLIAEQAAIDKLVGKEQADVDNEAVVVYGGKVGKLEAIFHIEWAGEGNPVDGWYYYPSRGREKSYVLKGSNPKNGVLILKEFTKGADGAQKLSANCRLTKRVTKSRIIWEGKMNNTDGQQHTMSFSRLR